MKIQAKVIFDNGYKIELIRPLHDIQMAVGTSVEVTIAARQVNLVNTFNNLLDESTQDMILDKLNEGRKGDAVNTTVVRGGERQVGGKRR